MHLGVRGAVLALTLAIFGGCGNSQHSMPDARPADAGNSSSAAAASEEKVLHVYNWSDYIGYDTVAQFERLTGIQVVYDVYDSNEILESKLLIGDSG